MVEDFIPYRMKAGKTALLVVDMQNDFVREGAPMSLDSCREAIPNSKKLIAACRKAEMPVVYLKFFTGPKKTLVWTWSPQQLPPVKCCWKNVKRKYEDRPEELECTDVIDELYPQKEDYIIEKYSYNGFYNTNLESVLRSNGIEYLIVFGALTPICIDDTIAGAFERQFKVYAVSDAIGYFSEEFHEMSMKKIGMKYGRVMTTEEILAEIIEAC